MKLIELVKTDFDFKKVTYFGIELFVPEDAQFLATNYAGAVFVYDKRPKRTCAFSFWACPNLNGLCSEVAWVDLEGMDWRETLMELG